MPLGAPRLQEPPPQPPNVTSQQGALSTVGAAVNRNAARELQGGGPAGELTSMAETHPQGAILAQADAVEKLMRQMSRMSPLFAPFANRISVILRRGLGEILAESEPAGISSSAPFPFQGPRQSNRPGAGEEMAGFPG